MVFDLSLLVGFLWNSRGRMPFLHFYPYHGDEFPQVHGLGGNMQVVVGNLYDSLVTPTLDQPRLLAKPHLNGDLVTLGGKGKL
jgi:hypothetical protein